MLRLRDTMPSSSLASYDPFYRPFSLIDDLFGQQVAMLPKEDITRDLRPVLNIDLIETENEYQIHADLPGVNPDDLDISIENDTLTIKGERKQKHEEKTDTAHRVERSYGKVQRSIRLPKNADQKNVTANHENGVLTVAFPKMEIGPKAVKVPLTKK